MDINIDHINHGRKLPTFEDGKLRETASGEMRNQEARPADKPVQPYVLLYCQLESLLGKDS
ncbi:MAG: hypothetical protein JW943_01390 [Deltaproteobacteria bacterium]|nr:hypothetical protein [Deltaproteobacteria bacterium]